MPWTPDEATSHTKLADTPKRKRMWAHVANNVLKETRDEGRAVRAGNAAVADDHKDSSKAFYQNARYLING